MCEIKVVTEMGPAGGIYGVLPFEKCLYNLKVLRCKMVLSFATKYIHGQKCSLLWTNFVKFS